MGSTLVTGVLPPSAPESIASRTPIAASAGAQLRSTILLYWYHATAIRPCGPAVSPGQLTVTPGRATTTGFVHVRPPLRLEVSMTRLATGVRSPLQPPDDGPWVRSSGVQVGESVLSGRC